MNIAAIMPQDILSMKPCSTYTLEFIQTFGETMSAVEILKLDAVPLADRSWFAAHLPAKYVALWREQFLTRCITNHGLGCGIPKVEQWAAKWLSGEDRSKAAARAAEEAARAARAAEEAAWAAEAAEAEEAAVAWAAEEAAWAAEAAEAEEAAVAWAAEAASEEEEAWVAWAASEAEEAAAAWAAWAKVAAEAARAAAWAAWAKAARAEAARARAREYELQIQEMITVLEADNQK